MLCVDGLDPDKWLELGLDWPPYSRKLTIPDGCYVTVKDENTGEIERTPHTTRVWPTIFSGREIDYGLVQRKGLRKLAHDALVRLGATWKGKPQYRVAPINRDLETILSHGINVHWNIPTISPEWISTFPTYEEFMKYCSRELALFEILSRAVSHGIWEIAAVYTRIVDAWGHNRPDDLDTIYRGIAQMVVEFADRDGLDVVLISDHGCLEGKHTDYAYLGTTWPTMAESVLDVRGELERRLATGLRRIDLD